MSTQNPNGVSKTFLIVACFLFSMLSVAISMWFMRDVTSVGAEGQQRIVFVNAQKIIDAKILEISLRKVTEAEAASEGSEFAKRLQDQIAEYRNNGMTVLHGAALLSENDEHDLTNQTAIKLGVNLEAKPGQREQ